MLSMSTKEEHKGNIMHSEFPVSAQKSEIDGRILWCRKVHMISETGPILWSLKVHMISDCSVCIHHSVKERSPNDTHGNDLQR